MNGNNIESYSHNWIITNINIDDIFIRSKYLLFSLDLEQMKPLAQHIDGKHLKQ